MRKWIYLVGIMLFCGLAVAVPGGEEGLPESSPVTPALDDGGDPIPPFEAMAETTANIYIYVTLRQPEGPAASGIEIESTYCASGFEFVQIKAHTPLWSRDSAEVQYYLLYRTQWAAFNWGDLNILTGYQDSMWIMNPIEDWITHTDPDPAYRWYSYTSTRDEFQDSIWSREDIWGTGYGTQGVCDENVNWYYVCVAVDSTPMPRKVSPEPSDPVGEVDQWLYVGDNIISYPVDIGVGRADSLAMVIDTIDGTPAAEKIHKWDATTQMWTEIAFIFFGSWSGSDPVAPGDVFRVVKTDPTTVLWSAHTPGYVPYDADITNHTLTLAPGTSTGDNYVMMPYQEYNLLLGINSSMEGIDYVRAKDMLGDITRATKIHKWDGATQMWTEIAYYFFGSPSGNTRVLPGLPYRVVVDGTCTWPPE
ncbi:hypothetical protein DRQ33_03975 [bacterium]|nr:MAG: hypothetical protein DRQ33_03975 [bacterium]